MSFEKWPIWLAAGTIFYVTWVWGGLRSAWLSPALWAAGVLLGIVLIAPFRGARRPRANGEQRGGGVAWWRDPFFYCGAIFLGYLAIQWWNAGRVQFYDIGLAQWRYSPPRHSAWPSAVMRGEAVQMLQWFFPAWALALTVRAPLADRRALHGFLSFLAYSAGLLALFGLVLFATGTPSMYWLASVDHEFFASFGYSNHAAAYFVLMGALSFGLLFREIFQPNRPIRRRRVITLLATALLCLTGANLSLSRAGVILAWALACFATLYVCVRGWRLLPPAARVNLAAASVGAVGVFFFAVAGLGDTAIRKQFTPPAANRSAISPLLDKVNLSLGHRPQFASAAISMWKDNPFYGVGGWGYKYFIADYLPPSQWDLLAKSGWANVHCDPLQFLVEFGLIGFGLMLAALAPLTAAALRCGARADPLWAMGLAGLTLVGVFSFIDLPFRCPGIQYAWIVVLAALPRVGIPSQCGPLASPR